MGVRTDRMVEFVLSSSPEGLGYFTVGGSANNGMATREDETGLLQRSSVWTPSRNEWRGGNSTTRVLLMGLLQQCLLFTLDTPGFRQRNEVVLKERVDAASWDKCIMSASGCHPVPEEPGRWEENFWSPAMPYISSIFSES
ncbi:uncharacterized protein C22orf24 homolog [Phoca vitulina]|uniref:uncharacterized protein C22orf24 homolog n=1 Tax=Phoca vitulina TaxID=9720 RepID=UPI00139606A7|nr:uncharacterized protein C22orf24 homolog [Phoca vitulina]